LETADLIVHFVIEIGIFAVRFPPLDRAIVFCSGPSSAEPRIQPYSSSTEDAVAAPKSGIRTTYHPFDAGQFANSRPWETESINRKPGFSGSESPQAVSGTGAGGGAIEQAEWRFPLDGDGAGADGRDGEDRFESGGGARGGAIAEIAQTVQMFPFDGISLAPKESLREAACGPDTTLVHAHNGGKYVEASISGSGRV
jgi:hypothetical protein